MDHDAALVLPLIGRNISYLYSSSKNVKQVSKAHINKRFGEKTLDILNTISIKDRIKLKARYRQELALFGYNFNANTSRIKLLYWCN